MVKKLSEVEGYRLEPYALKNPKGGVTIGNGIDFSQQTADKFKRLGIPEKLIKKIEGLGYFGATGKEAERLIGITQGVHGITESEVAQISNAVTDDGIKQLKKKIPDWDSYTGGQKAVMASMFHQYGNAVFGYKAFEQFKNKDWDALRKNLESWKDSTPEYGEMIEGRRKRESRWLNESNTGTNK